VDEIRSRRSVDRNETKMKPEQEQYVDEIRSRRSVDRNETKMKRGYKSRSRSNAGSRVITRPEQEQYGDEIKTRRSADRGDTNLKRGHKSRSRSNATRLEQSINRVSQEFVDSIKPRVLADRSETSA